MGKIIRLTESELIKVVKRIISEQYFDDIETSSEESSGSNVVQNLEREMGDYKNKMDGFLSDLKSSGDIDWNRLLKQVRNQTSEIFHKYDDESLSREDSLNLFNTFSNLQSNLLNHYKGQYRNS
ncbi:MAG: hypothetical protein RLZ10_2871 [Bacteroidota bacterium]|jgi:hypothetical protein